MITLCAYFNPHSREGSDMNLYADYTFYVSISIHTPAKGVTYPKCLSGIREAISIHTPAKGVTWQTVTAKRCWHYFNPHSREGSDRKDPERVWDVPDFNPHSREGSDRIMPYNGRGEPISIHTPAKGVTKRNPEYWSNCTDFNPHSREGSDSNFA